MEPIKVERLGANMTKVRIALAQGNDLVVWLSYDAVVAAATWTEMLVAENDWSQTTGKHITQMCGRGPRVPVARVHDLIERTLLHSAGTLVASMPVADGVNLETYERRSA